MHRCFGWAHVPLFVLAVGIVGFVGLYLGTGRWWLGGAAVGVRLLCFILDLCFYPNLNYREIASSKQVDFLGDRVWVVAQSIPSRRSLLAELGGLLVLPFVVDASLRLWRQGGPEARRRAVAVGGSLTLFTLAAFAFATFVNLGGWHVPYCLSLPFLAFVVAMGYELSRDVIRAARMAEELRENAESMALAASAARLAHWRWDIPNDAISFAADGQRLFGLPEGAAMNLGRFLEAIHPEDR